MRTRLFIATALTPLALAACGDPAADTAAAPDGDAAAAGAQAASLPDIVLDDPQAFPESITSLADGTLIAGSAMGRVFRALPGETVATAWIEKTPENGMQSVLGVLADEPSDFLWLCSTPNVFVQPVEQGVTKLMVFRLSTGESLDAFEFPPNAQGATGVCNDIAVASDGTVFVTDTPGARILTLASDAEILSVWGEDPLFAGIDGIAFAEDGTLYVNNVQTQQLIRVGRTADGAMGDLEVLATSIPLDGPDGMRPLGGNRFLLANGNNGRIDIVDVQGMTANITPIREGLQSSPGVTRIGDYAYAIEGKINYLMDPSLQGQDPGPFTAIAIPLPQD